MLEKKFYTCKYDRTFKAIVCNENDPSILKAVLSIAVDANIDTIEIKKCELPVNHQNERVKTVDLLVELDNKRLVHVELNLKGDDYTNFRNYCFFCHTISNKTKRGESYDIDASYIHIDFTYGINKHEFYHEYYLQTDNHEKYVKNVRILEYDMDYIRDNWYNKPEYKYLAMLDMDLDNLKTLAKEDEVVMDYMEKLSDLNENSEFQAYMSAEQDALMMMNTRLRGSRKEGIEEGKKEMIKSLANQNFPIDAIAKAACMSVDEVESILSESK